MGMKVFGVFINHLIIENKKHEMSKLLINKYYTSLERAIQFGKSKNETSIRIPFLNLLNEYARKLNYEVVPEVNCMGTNGKQVRPDGILKTLFGHSLGLWESKDTKTNLDDEIDLKIKTGLSTYQYYI